MKVFIADDSEILCERLIELLAGLPKVEVIGCAHDAEGAIKAINECAPDVVILDIRMPGGSGIDVLQHIKKGNIPIVIVLTNYPYPQYRKRCLSAGADYFFDKSTEFDKLPGVFKVLLGE